MVKLIFLCRRRADITHAQYARLLLDGHVPLALRHHPLMREYVVNVVEASPADAAELDSIGVLCFDSLADFRERLYDSPAGERLVGRDVQRFMGGAQAYVTTEHIQLDDGREPQRGTRSAGIKLVCLLRRREGMTHAEFVKHWLTRHVPLALRHHAGLTSYVANVVDERLSNEAPELDGIAELGFANAPAWPFTLWVAPESERVMSEDVARFAGSAVTYRVGEYVQKLARPGLEP